MQVFLSSDLDLLLTWKYPHLAKQIPPSPKAACSPWTAQEGTLFPFSALAAAQEERGCSNFVLKEQCLWWGALGEVRARIKGGRNCMCSSKEFLAESNRDTKASEIHLRGNPRLYFLWKKTPKLYITDVPGKGIWLAKFIHVCCLLRKG